jgi:hypothetical protein
MVRVEENGGWMKFFLGCPASLPTGVNAEFSTGCGFSEDKSGF